MHLAAIFVMQLWFPDFIDDVVVAAIGAVVILLQMLAFCSGAL